MLFKNQGARLNKKDMPSQDWFNQPELTAFLRDSGLYSERESHKPRPYTERELSFFRALEDLELLAVLKSQRKHQENSNAKPKKCSCHSCEHKPDYDVSRYWANWLTGDYDRI